MSEKQLKSNSNTNANSPTKSTKYSEIVKKVREVYSKYEKGEVDERGFSKAINLQTGLDSSKLDIILKSAKEDKKDFKSIIQSLDIVDRPTNYPKFTNEDLKNSTFKNYPRYIKQKASNEIKTPMYTNNKFFGNVEVNLSNKNKYLQEYVSNFVHGYMDAKSFEEALISKRINPEIEEIKKHIRHSSTGPVNSKDLMFSVIKYGDSKFTNDPNKINLKKRDLNNFEHHQFEDDSNKVVAVTGGNNVVAITQKKKVENNQNFVSQKEIYNIEQNVNDDKIASNLKLTPIKNNNILQWDQTRTKIQSENNFTQKRLNKNLFNKTSENHVQKPQSSYRTNAVNSESKENTLKYK